MGEDFWDIFINNLWQRENAQGYKEIEGKGGYHNGRYYPYMTNDGRWDVGPGFYLDDQPESFQEKAKTTGFTKQELNDTIRQRLHNEPQYFKQRIIKEGGNPTRVTNDVYAGLLDMFWQRNNGLYQDFPNLWKAVAKQDYESMRKESRTKYYNLKTGKDEIDTGRWNFRKQAYFHDPQPAANTHASTFVQQIDADRQGIDSLVSVPNYLKQKPITVPYRVKADGGSIRHKQWDELSMSEISDIIGAAVRNGITTLPEIRQKWNEFSLSEDEKVNSEESDRSEGSDGKNGANRPYGEDDDITGYIGPEVTITAQYPYEQRVINTMNASSPEFLERLRNNDRRDIDNGDGTHSTHRLGSADNIVFPEIQDVNGQLVDYKNLPWQQQVQKAIENNDYIAFPTEGDARYFGEHYKKYFPTFFNQLYSDGGNLFKSGGYVPSMAVKKDISNWEGDSMKTNRSFEAEAKDFNRVIPQSIQDNLNQQQLDALYSYGYNVGMGNLKKRVLPTLSNFVNGRAGAEDVASHMWASRDKELRGLRRRRAWERNKFIGNTPYKNRQSIITEALQADLSNLPSEKDIQMEQPLLPPNPTYYGSIVDYQLPQQPMNESKPVTTSNDKDMDMMRLIGFMRSKGLLGDGSGDTFMAKAPVRSKYTIGAHNDYDTLLDSSWYRKGGPLYAEGGRKDGDPYSTLDYVTPRELWFDGSGRAHTVNGNVGPIVLQDVDVTTKKNGAGLKDDNGNYYNTSSKSYPRLYGDKTGNDINNVMLGTMALGTAPMTLPEIAAVSTMAGNAASDALMSTKAGQVMGKFLANPYTSTTVDATFAADFLQNVNRGNYNPLLAFEAIPFIKFAKPVSSAAKELGNSMWNSTYAQYPRYYFGKLYYGRDTELPTLFRKYRTVPEKENGNIRISPINNRLAYEKTGEESPLITNMTTDVPVRSHSFGNWDEADVLAFPGKTLLGKHVISTRPSDTFTFGDLLTVKPSKTTYISGKSKALNIASQRGMNTVSSQNAKDIIRNHAFDSKDYSDYAKEMQEISRSIVKAPTVTDYKFMDWVFQPQYKSKVLPYQELNNLPMKDVDALPEGLAELIGNSLYRKYLSDPQEWRNVLYHPASTVEYQFRKKNGIVFKDELSK